MASPLPLQVVHHPGPAAALLDPARQQLLAHLTEPDSASGVARRLRLPRQRVNYHLRELERAGLDAAWARLLGPGGFRVTPAEPKEGESYEVVAPGGQRFTGTVQLDLPGQTLAGTVSELGDGWFRLLTWKDPSGNTGVWAWVSTYCSDHGPVQQFKDSAQEALERLFPTE